MHTCICCNDTGTQTDNEGAVAIAAENETDTPPAHMQQARMAVYTGALTRMGSVVAVTAELGIGIGQRPGPTAAALSKHTQVVH